MSKKLTLNDFIQRAKKIHEDKYRYDQVEYKGTKQKVKIYCNECKEYFWQTPDHHLKGSGCPICMNGPKDLFHFIKKAKKIHGDKYDYQDIIYINSQTKIKIFCKKCKCFFEQRPNGHLNGKGCPYCVKNRKLTKEEFIIRAIGVHGNKYDYSQVKYLGMEKPVKIKCKTCGKVINQLPSNHLKGKGCYCCNKSKGENLIKEYLIKHNINFEFQKRFNDCRDKQPLPFDFYLPAYKLCIEYQGKQHYEPSFYTKKLKLMEKGIIAFKLQKKHDRIKKLYCKQNNLYLVEIKYNENIEDRLKLELFKNGI